MHLGALVEGLDVKLLTPRAEDVRVCDLTEDSRTVVPGSLFVARAGRKTDGRQFALDAAHNGAVAVLTDDADSLRSGSACPNVAIAVARDVAQVSATIAERFYDRPSSRLELMGVTGTNGKTTTTWLAWEILNAAKHRCGLIGTVKIDDGVEIADAQMTTPPAMELSRTLARMVEAGCTAAVMETSSHALHQGRVAALEFDVGVFTNLTRDHLDYHGTMESYAAAKASLFARLPSSGTAIVNADDPAWTQMVEQCKAKVIRCSQAGEADATVRVASSGLEGMRLGMTGPFGAIEVRVPLIGLYNAMNALQAAVACHAMGLDAGAIAAGLERVTAPPGRLERVSTSHDKIDCFVDFAHTDDGLANVLGGVRNAMTRGKLWVVFGAGGDKDKGKRPRMGKAAAELADAVVVTSDNPRSERPGDIIDMVLSGITPALRGKVTVQADRARAIAHAIEHAEPGDAVVLAGKGHETEQILSDGAGGLMSIHFDDREVAAAALADRRAGRKPTEHRRVTHRR